MLQSLSKNIWTWPQMTSDDPRWLFSTLLFVYHSKCFKRKHNLRKKVDFEKHQKQMMKKGLKIFFEGWKPDAHLELAKTIILMYHMLMFEIRIENAPILKNWYFWNFKRRLWRHPRKIFPVFSSILGQNRELFPGSTKKGGVISRLRNPYWNSSRINTE